MKTEEIQVAWDPQTGIVMGERLGQPVTIEELVAATGYTMDEVELVEDQTETKCWPTSMKVNDQPIQIWNHYLRIKLNIRYDEVVSKSIREELIAEVRAEKVGQWDPVPPMRDHGEDGVVVELDMFDPHFGMLAWGKETGVDHDLDIIARRYREAASFLKAGALRLGYPVQRWLLIIGQDMFHTDQTIEGSGGATTRGTPQDVDTRLAKSARVVRKLLTEIVLDLLEVAPVDVVVVPGNHDEERTWWMGEILDARFYDNPNVEVDNRPMLRKFYRIGNSLLGLSHGHNLKPKDLRDYMSQEARGAWADTVFREWHLGHFHHEHVLDERGIVVRYAPSLAGTDKWHYENGFTHAQKGARAYVWTQAAGITHTVNYNCPPTREELDRTEPMLRGDR